MFVFYFIIHFIWISKSFELYHSNMSASIPSRATYETARKLRLSHQPQLYDVMIADIRRVVVQKLESGDDLPLIISIRVEHFRNSFTLAKKTFSDYDMMRTIAWETFVADLKREGFGLGNVALYNGYDPENGGNGMYCSVTLKNIHCV